MRNDFKYGKNFGGIDPIFDEGNIFKTFISIPSGQIKATKKATSTVKANLSDANEEYKKVVNDAVNDAVIQRLKTELMDIIINKGMSLSQLMANHAIKRATAQRDMKMLKDAGLINFIGAPKTGKYMISNKLSQIIKQ